MAFEHMASLILVRNVVGELQPKRTLAASRGFLAAARLSCYRYRHIAIWESVKNSGFFTPHHLYYASLTVTPSDLHSRVWY